MDFLNATIKTTQIRSLPTLKIVMLYTNKIVRNVLFSYRLLSTSYMSAPILEALYISFNPLTT